MSNKKVLGFKKSLKRAMALLMVVLLTAGSVSVLGTGVAGYQYDSSDIYISTGADADYGNDNDIDSDYSDTDYEEEGYYYIEEDEADDEYGLYGVLTTIIPIMPLSDIAVYTWDDMQTIVAAATAGDVINFYLQQDITSTGSITIPADVTVILGSTAGNTFSITHTGDNQRHFNPVEGILHLNNVHITTARGIPDVVPLPNAARSGGIRVASSGRLYLNAGSIISNNRWDVGGGIDARGTSVVTLSDTALVYGNFAATTLGSGSGGGIHMHGSATLHMNGGTIQNNTSLLNNAGGVHLGSNSRMYMTDGRIIGNKTTEPGISGVEDIADGGGVNVSTNSTFHMSGGIIGGTGAYANTAINGGGVTVQVNGQFTMSGGSIEGNFAEENGGGVHISHHSETNAASMTMTGGAIEDNTASQNGGGVAVVNGATFTMTGGTIEDNTATQSGGGVAVQNGANFTMSGTALIYDNRVSEASTDNIGGGVSVSGIGTTFIMSNGIVENNHAARGGGVATVDEATFTMTGGIIESNTTGGIVSALGAGVFVYTGASFTMRTPLAGEEGYDVNAQPPIIARNRTLPGNNSRNGGGVHVRGAATTFYMYDGIIEHNITHTATGGGVAVVDGARFEMFGDSVIRYNVAGNNGGGVRVIGADSLFIMHDGEIYGNISSREVYGASPTAAMQGGGINITDNANVIMHGGVIRDNRAVSGGGLRVALGTFTANAGSITGNIAEYYGGGIWTAAYDNITISDTVIFSGNTANAPHDHGIANRLSSTPIDATYSGGGQGGNPQNTNWATVSIPGTHALNNFDINYTGTPLFTLTVTVEDEDGNPIPGATVVIRNEDGDTIFTGITNDEGRVSIFVPDGEYEVTASHPDYDDVPPVDVVIDGTGETVVIVLPTPPHTVTFLPGTTATVTSMPSNRTVANGAQISTDGGTVATPTREGYTFLGWLQTIPAVAGNISSENVGNIAVTQDMTFVAQWQPNNDDNGGGDNGGSTPPPPPALIKNPDNRYVYVGDYIDWTLRNIHNYTSGAVANFSIVDMPGRGLNFASGRLPAFTNGTGITFDIRYTVAGSDAWHTYATGIDASQPFTFSLPQPGNLHYTNIGFFFGTVPAGFALGNEIVLTFLVSNDAPNNVLINRFALRYDNIAREGQGTAIVRPDAPPVGGVDNQVPTPETPQQPVLPEPPSITEPIYVPQPPLTAEQPQIAPTHGNEHEPATTGTGRVNPQTSDNFSPVGIIVSALGIIASLGAMVLISKKKKQAEI